MIDYLFINILELVWKLLTLMPYGMIVYFIIYYLGEALTDLTSVQIEPLVLYDSKKRIAKYEARKLWEQGHDIVIVPGKVNKYYRRK